MQTLEQLKAENADSGKPTAEAPQPKPEEVTLEAAEVEEIDDQDADSAGDESEAEDGHESWMDGDDQASQGSAGDGEKQFSHRDVAAAKTKLRAKLDRQHQSETEALRAKIAELENAQRESVVQQVPQKPTRDKFYDHDDPDEAYAEALVDWKLKVAAAEQQATHQQREQQRNGLERQYQIESQVNQHYARAEKLAESSGISPELYQSADHAVRSAVDQVFPGGGDPITDALIASLGDGSEKVFYHLGRNQARLTELTQLLKEDPSGIRASVHLGKLAAQLTGPAKRTSNAPAPATRIKGDMSTTAAGSALKKKYQEAHKSGSAQKAFDLKRQARGQGIDTSTW